VSPLLDETNQIVAILTTIKKNAETNDDRKAADAG
jgi:hypothetical protein